MNKTRKLKKKLGSPVRHTGLAKLGKDKLCEDQVVFHASVVMFLVHR